jgi:hypothetical protein
MVSTITTAKLPILSLDFDHVDEIGTIIIAYFQFMSKLDFRIFLKSKLVDCFNNILMCDFIVVSL